ncbi:MAG: DUF4124 domain-containing protein [Desulfobacteraceae bacterium]|nr:DUF4124 domain-containing protein [Desulfobacteraceae bacterium]
MNKSIVFTIAAVLFIYSSALSETLYLWVDDAGVKHYTNHPPPEGAKLLEKKTQDTPETQQRRDTSIHRESFEHMADQAQEEFLKLDQERKLKELERQKKLKQLAEKKRQAEIDAQTSIIKKEIKKIENRALSPTFSQGMKDNLIQKLQKELDQLQKKQD